MSILWVCLLAAHFHMLALYDFHGWKGVYGVLADALLFECFCLLSTVACIDTLFV